MDEVRSLASTQSGSGARQQTQVVREQWEAHWLQQQRLALRVVEHEARDNGRGEDMPKETDAVPLVTDACSVRPESCVHTAAAQLPSAHSILSVDETPVHLSARGAAVATVGACAVEPTIETRTVSTRETARLAPQLGTPSQPLPRSVLWREDNGVAMAMRLHVDVAEEATLTQLRHWLKDAGIRLVRLLINGRSHENAAGSSQADGSDPAAYNSRRR